MGHRLSRIVTRTGDEGQTSLGSGLRVDKDSPVIEALGAVDELNSFIGLLIALSKTAEVQETLLLVQHDLFDLGAQISVPGTPLLSLQHVERVERSVESLSAGLGMLKEFILPGGATSSAMSHVARTVCRRAERCLFKLSEVDRQAQFGSKSVESSEKYGLVYLNRLSDLLFIIARIENKAASRDDVMWEKGKSIQEDQETS